MLGQAAGVRVYCSAHGLGTWYDFCEFTSRLSSLFSKITLNVALYSHTRPSGKPPLCPVSQAPLSVGGPGHAQPCSSPLSSSPQVFNHAFIYVIVRLIYLLYQDQKLQEENHVCFGQLYPQNLAQCWHRIGPIYWMEAWMKSIKTIFHKPHLYESCCFIILWSLLSFHFSLWSS